MFSEKKFLTTQDGTQLHLEVRENGKPVWLIATHGIGEHLGRHNYLVDLFSQDFNILQYDLRGHGQSSGQKAWVEDFTLFRSDLGEITEYLRANYQMDRFVLFGHSMGALITCDYLQNLDEKATHPIGVFVNAPPVGYTGAAGVLLKVTPGLFINKLSELSGGANLGGMVDLNYLSHDTRVKENYIADELNALKLHSKLLLGMVAASRRVFSRPIRPHGVAFVTCGSQDKIVNVSDLKTYFSLIEKSFLLKEFEGAYHEIHNEVEKYRRPYFQYLKEKVLECAYGPAQ